MNKTELADMFANNKQIETVTETTYLSQFIRKKWTEH